MGWTWDNSSTDLGRVSIAVPSVGWRVIQIVIIQAHRMFALFTLCC